ncbi:MAG TPA: VOC family protein [Bryobacteraceae bacterium]|jgi:catechol 2,3-dioxygenase-like lactoylglutathione lyase family enzyme
MKPRFLAALCLVALPLAAQLPAPNKAGISAGHDVLRAKDVDAANKFWQALGAKPVQFAGRLNLNMFPGVLILSIANGGGGGGQKGAPKAAPVTPPAPPAELLGSEGSSLDFIGFSVKDLKGSLANWADAGIKPLPGGTGKQVYVMSPDKIKVRITEDKSQAAPIVADTIKMMVPNVAEAQAWYAKIFGAEMVKHNGEMVADIPGSRIIFEQAKTPVAPSKGRAFDRIGLEVVGLDAFVKKLEDAGIKLDSPYRGKNEAMNAGFAVFQDPFGTLIEMSEGLSAVK